MKLSEKDFYCPKRTQIQEVIIVETSLLKEISQATTAQIENYTLSLQPINHGI